MSEFIDDTGIPVEYQDVYNEVREAYCDCGWMDEQYAKRCHDKGVDRDEDIWRELMRETTGFGIHDGRRNLSFRASRPVPPQIAKLIMDKAIIGYNDWTPDLLNCLPSGCDVFIAREGSVCLYIKGLELPKVVVKELKCDEYDEQNGEVRIWWD